MFNIHLDDQFLLCLEDAGNHRLRGILIDLIVKLACSTAEYSIMQSFFFLFFFPRNNLQSALGFFQWFRLQLSGTRLISHRPRYNNSKFEIASTTRSLLLSFLFIRISRLFLFLLQALVYRIIYNTRKLFSRRSSCTARLC